MRLQPSSLLLLVTYRAVGTGQLFEYLGLQNAGDVTSSAGEVALATCGLEAAFSFLIEPSSFPQKLCGGNKVAYRDRRVGRFRETLGCLALGISWAHLDSGRCDEKYRLKLR